MTEDGEKDVDGQRSLRKAIIIFAIVEALVMAAVAVYSAFRR
ncbi:MAG TPA: hypothetical protein VM864_08145 [Pyrinomonadaceae bacterium]|jgi:hypothetical protein|nr:hypothetical protein [Pyrinomonadaceae bacterium]